MYPTNIDEIMKDFCEAGAEAVRYYAEVSGLEPQDTPYMPEYFMPAFIFQKLGRSTRITLETSLIHLVRWNNDYREQRQLAKVPDADALQRMESLSVRSPRVDMVLFDSARPSEKGLLALVEFKAGWISFLAPPAPLSDRDKLLRILSLVDTCLYGIACGSMDKRQLEWQMSNLYTDAWYAAPVPSIFKDNRQFLFGARVFSNPMCSGSLAS